MIKNEIGNKYGKLTVIERAGSDAAGALWKCKCDCGNICIVRGGSLRNGHTKSCGCAKKNNGRKIVDLTGKRFGKLTVINFAYKNHHTYWNCQCDCGGKIIVRQDCLQNGNTTSCGCVRSKGEEFISSILNKNNCQYIKEYSFNDLKDQRVLRFDFAIIQDNTIKLIEFDGQQHFEAHGGWNNAEQLNQTQIRDSIKNKYCQDHNIPLLRVKYTDSLSEIENKIKLFL